MPIDLVPDLLAALRSTDGRAVIADAVRAVVREEIRSALAEQRETLQPLGKILGVSTHAALARLSRDPALRALGVPVGRRVLFRAHEVENYYRERARPVR